MSGLECDRCTAGFYNLASGEGCEKCNCDKDGSLEGSCNQVIYIKKQLLQSDSLFSIHHVLFFFFLLLFQLDGQCRCRVGFGGRDCSECEDFSWGDPKSIDGCTSKS